MAQGQVHGGAGGSGRGAGGFLGTMLEMQQVLQPRDFRVLPTSSSVNPYLREYTERFTINEGSESPN